MAPCGRASAIIVSLVHFLFYGSIGYYTVLCAARNRRSAADGVPVGAAAALARLPMYIVLHLAFVLYVVLVTVPPVIVVYGIASMARTLAGYPTGPGLLGSLDTVSAVIAVTVCCPLALYTARLSLFLCGIALREYVYFHHYSAIGRGFGGLLLVVTLGFHQLERVALEVYAQPWLSPLNLLLTLVLFYAIVLTHSVLFLVYDDCRARFLATPVR